MSDISVPISPSEMDRKLLLDTLDNMDVVRSGGKVVQGLVNRRSREKDNAEDINPAFPTNISEDADLSQIQKRAALNLLIREESSGGQNLGLETTGNTVGRYHIQKDKAALINPEIKDMTMTEYHRYILNNPEAEEELVSKYIDTEINKMLKNKGVDTSKLKHNEYASIVSNLYNKGNQPKLLDSAAKLTNFRKNNPRDKRFTETPYLEETKNKSQNVNQPAPIADTGADIPLPESKSKFPKERVIDLPPEEENKYEGVPFLRYKPVQKLLGLAEGGAVPMKEQMSMFEDGGLMDEGGSVDPVSGNDVPPGSTQEEVRDDIPAQLSEGEFVFPADVVRYIGLGNLMRMRQEAKMGLRVMDEMGQMGNSEEATIPDDLPFDINDLDMEDDDEYNTPQEFAVGGMPTPNPNTGVYYNPAATPTTGVAAAPTQAASQQFVQPAQPQQAAVPTMQAYQPAQVPTFEGFVGQNIPGVDFEYVDYTNEAGKVIKLRKSKSTGQLLDPVPEGYSYVDPEATKTEEVVTTPTTPQTTSVREEGDNAEKRAQKEKEMYGPGGGRLSIGGEKFGVSFDNMGTLPGALSVAQGAFGLATGKPLPSDAIVNFKQGDLEFSLTGYEYNQLKDTIKGAKKGANSDEAETIFDDLKKQALKRKEIQTKIDAFKASEQLQQQQAKQDKKANEKGIKDAISFEQLIGSGADDDRGDGSGMDVFEAAEAFQQAKQDSGEGKPDQSSGSSTGGYYDFNQGGLASKPKPKVKKKMKKGGLASKK